VDSDAAYSDDHLDTSGNQLVFSHST
jgi:hypothetical protein